MGAGKMSSTSIPIYSYACVYKCEKNFFFFNFSFCSKQTMFVFLFQNFFHVASFVFDSSKEIFFFFFWKKNKNWICII